MSRFVDRSSICPAQASDGGEPAAAAKNYLQNVDQTLAHRILNEVVDSSTNVRMADIVGLEGAKKALHEIVVLPALRPEVLARRTRNPPARRGVKMGSCSNTYLAGVSAFLPTRHGRAICPPLAVHGPARAVPRAAALWPAG